MISSVSLDNSRLVIQIDNLDTWLLCFLPPVFTRLVFSSPPSVKTLNITMRVSSLLTLALASLALACPSYAGKNNDYSSGKGNDQGSDHSSGDDHGNSSGSGSGGHGHCISRHEARDLAQAYAALVGAFNEKDANRWLADDFVDYSASINAFVGKPLDGPSFDKASFIASQGAGNLPPTPIEVIGEPVVDCDRVAILWSSTFGKGWPSRGISIVGVRRDEGGHGGKWVMTRWDVEFNSLAWAYDMGQYYCLFGQGYGDASACGAPKDRRGVSWE